MSFARLDALCRKLEALGHAEAMLQVDEAVSMPPGGGEKRAEALGTIAGLAHELATSPAVGDWIAAAKAENLDAAQQVALREFERVHRDRTCLSAEFVNRKVNAQIRSEQLWRSLRDRNDWDGFLPAFEEIVALAREEAQLRAAALDLPPYDALVEQFDPGSRSAEIAAVFADLKDFLTGFIPEALEAQARRHAARPVKPFHGAFPPDRQKMLGVTLMTAAGFDFDHGRLDISHHPFCNGVPSDVRMTTRYTTHEFLSSLMGILHETGHALYEQNLPQDWSHWPLGSARGMAMHESQSLFVEKQLGRNPAFWRWALPMVDKHLDESWTIDDILPHVHHVERGLIRVDADEVTYPLHVILRFELERQLIAGSLAPADIPEAWDAGMQASLGLSTIDSPADGPMQDVHWPSGAFGYFPSYTLGAMIAAQLWSAMLRDVPHADAEIAAGRFDALNDWRREHIWSVGSRWSTPDLIERATGTALDPRHFIDHLRKRYGRN